ncbi:hypothetical protein [Helicobacter sp. 11S03491-1]|uniref:hypothetical protein n=1 Tax=Helicobacter sp. 11S03491-1 TaxID=1476196 RepID=UPI0015D9A78A|nr:hypothetical protein [Helicobacter sp. 11S03491-1]
MKKQNKIIYFDNKTQVFLDTHLTPIKPSKSDTIIECIHGAKLIKHQIRIDKNSPIPSAFAISDWLYAQCIQEGIFDLNIQYALTYLHEETSVEEIFQIYAYKLELAFSNYQVFIPDIFLPMALDSKYLQSSLFLFDDNLVFYHHDKLLYHSPFPDTDAIFKALHYIRAIYTMPSALYTCTQKSFDLNIPVVPINTLIENTPEPMVTLAFVYFSKLQNTPLPILKSNEKFYITKSKSFNMLLQIALMAILMLLYPTFLFIHGLYLKKHSENLAYQNIQILQNNTSAHTQTHASLARLENIKNQNNSIEEHLNLLNKIQISYTPRYNFIAKLAKIIQDKNIFIEDFYFVSDIFENILSFKIRLKASCEQEILHFIQDLKNTSLIANNHQEIFHHKIYTSQKEFSTEVIWVSNAY